MAASAAVLSAAPLGPLAPRHTAVLPFAYNVAITAGATGVFGGVDYELRLNDVYQPTNPSTHQPYGRDEFAAFYDYYKVKRVKVAITPVATGSTNISMFAMRLRAPQDGTFLTGDTISQAMERPGTRCLWINPGSGTPAVLENDIDMSEACQVTKREYEADLSQFAAPITQSPTLIPTIVFNAASPAATTSSLFVYVRLEFVVEFYGRKTLAQS